MRKIPLPVSGAMTRVLQSDIPGVSRSDKCVLSWLVSFCKLKDPLAPVYPRIEVLAEYCTLSTSSVKRCLSRLQRAGLIYRRCQERSERTGNFTTVRTILTTTTLQIAGLISENATSPDIPAPPPVIPKSPDPTPREATPENDPRPGVKTTPTIENELRSTKRKDSYSTERDGPFQNSKRLASPRSIPGDLQWLVTSHQIEPGLIAWGMKVARAGGTCLSAIIASIKDRLTRSDQPGRYLAAVLKNIRSGGKAWDSKAPTSVGSPVKAFHQEQEMRDMEEKWANGQIYKHAEKAIWLRASSLNLVEVYHEAPSVTSPIMARTTLAKIVPGCLSGEWKKTASGEESNSAIPPLSNALRVCLTPQAGVK